MDYQIQLDNFTGPLDLLLFFIRRDELDIMDIPIARITKEYLGYLKALQTLNVALAGDFIMMAATLMRIKAKMLLPQLPSQDDEEIEDPRTELVQRLLEYQRYKEAAENLGNLVHARTGVFARGLTAGHEFETDYTSYYLDEVSLYDLVTVFNELLKRMPSALTYDLAREKVSVREQMAVVLARFVDQSRYMFGDLVPHLKSKQELIATFIAVLELIRDHQILVVQKGMFDDFALERIEA